MSKRTRVLLVLVAAALLAAAIAAWIVARHGMAIGLWAQRRAFIGMGLERHRVASPVGEQTVFEAPGPPGAPTVVLIHGFGDQASTWSGTVSPLLERFHVVVPDLAGHGQSEPTGDELTYAQLVAALEASVRDRAGDRAVTLVGNSLGGWLAMRYALDHPDRVERLVLVNAAGLQHPIDKSVLIPQSRESLQVKMDNLFPRGSYPNLPGFAQDQLIAMIDLPRFGRLFDSLEAAGGLDDRLPGLAVPTTLLWGTPDGFFPIDYARRLQAAIPGAELRELPGCGHAPQLICAPDFTAQLGEVLSAPLR